MHFSVKIRRQDGSLETRTMEAASRARLLADLKRDGVVPVSVSEAKGGAPKAPSSIDFTRIAIAVLALSAIGVAAWIYFQPKKSAPAKEERVEKKRSKGLVAEVKPAEAEKPVAEPEEKPEPKKKEPRLAYLKNLTPEERRAEIKRLQAERPINLQAPTNRLFATGTEQVISWIFTTTPGDMPPILPNLPAFELAHLQEILDHTNTVTEADSERSEEAKLTVDLVKQHLKDYVAKGGDPQGFLQYYRDELQQAFETRREAQRSLMQAVREEPEIAGELMSELNAELDAKGIKRLALPRKLRERLGIE